MKHLSHLLPSTRLFGLHYLARPKHQPIYNSFKNCQIRLRCSDGTLGKELPAFAVSQSFNQNFQHVKSVKRQRPIHQRNDFGLFQILYFSSFPKNFKQHSEQVHELKRLLSPQDQRMLNLLMDYKHQHGDCHVPTGTSNSIRQERQRLNVSEELASWVSQQRELHQYIKRKKGKIGRALSTKMEILESMGFIWSAREAQWQRLFNRLDSYSRLHNGNTQVDKEKDKHLWTWVDQQRKVYQRGAMSPEREILLREIGFIFDLHEAKWWENYETLIQYKEKHGDTLVPTNNDSEKNMGLGNWVARQRRERHDGSLAAERIKALDEIGFSWDAQSDSWNNFYTQLCEFYKEHNHTRVPRSMGPLYHWVDRQRRNYRELFFLHEKSSDKEHLHETLLKDGNLKKLLEIGFEWEDSGTEKENRIKLLMELTFEVAVHDERWMKSFKQLCDFKKAFGHFSIPSDSSEYKALTLWVRHQRYLYNANKLSKHRVDLLDSIDFAWTAEAARWHRMYEELIAFHRENGHVKVPSNSAIYRWVQQQRRKLMSRKNDEGSCNHRKNERLQVLKEILLS